MKTRITYLFLVAFLFNNCTNKQYEKIQEVVNGFYSWYLSEYYNNPNIKNVQLIEIELTKDSIYQLNQKKYFEILNKTRFFSKNFIINEREKINHCNEELKKINLKNIENGGGIPTEDINLCNFMNYIPWVGGQGDICEKITISDIDIEGETAKVKVEAVDTVIIELVFENDFWKINRIYLNHPKFRN